MTQDDLSDFDAIVDRSINGTFFYRPQSANDVVNHIKELRTLREEETHKKILDALIDAIWTKYILRKLPMKRGELFRPDFVRTFGLLGGKVKCFALPLDQVLLSNGASGEEYPSMFAEVKKRLPSLDSIFHFDNDAFCKALQYVSPFGRVAFEENVQYVLADGGQERGIPSLVIAHIIYSAEEAEGKTSEEDLLKQYFSKMIDMLTIWSTQRSGIRSILAEVTHRQRRITHRVAETKRELEICRSNSIDKIKLMQRFHQLAKVGEEADKLLNDIRETKDKMEGDIKVLEKQYKEAKWKKENTERIDITNQAIADMQKKCCFGLFEKINRNGRAFAMSNDLRRPWDTNFDMNAYSRQGNNLQESRVVLNPNDLITQLEKVLSSIKFVWAQMENMAQYENEPFKDFTDSSLLDKAAGLMKGKILTT